MKKFKSHARILNSDSKSHIHFPITNIIQNLNPKSFHKHQNPIIAVDSSSYYSHLIEITSHPKCHGCSLSLMCSQNDFFFQNAVHEMQEVCLGNRIFFSSTIIFTSSFPFCAPLLCLYSIIHV